MEWNLLLNEKRRKPKDSLGSDAGAVSPVEFRTEIERDYDRILFSAPVRRLADKTQVFPLERNDSVRNRLTHSHEVSNLCRGLGLHLCATHSDLKSRFRDVSAMLAAVGLAHDLGNPPFGHQGEKAIQSWFVSNRAEMLDRYAADAIALSDSQKNDFLKFEGNAQTLRILTRLQIRNDDFGLDLTYGTLAALMKYPVASDEVDATHAGKKKHGYFQSEAHIVRDIWTQTGLGSGIRHPLTFLMEACDDIAYRVIDAEDAVKKGLVSFADLIDYLKHKIDSDPLAQTVIKDSLSKHHDYQAIGLSPSELNDLSMQRFRVYAIAAMVQSVFGAFSERLTDILAGKMHQDLLAVSTASALGEALRKFDKEHAYRHKSVLALESEGASTIRKLMGFMWRAISERESDGDLGSLRTTPFSRYAYERISDNYKRVACDSSNKMPLRYREAQLLTDMMSGMTDSFAMSLCKDLEKHDKWHSK